MAFEDVTMQHADINISLEGGKLVSDQSMIIIIPLYYMVAAENRYKFIARMKRKDCSWTSLESVWTKPGLLTYGCANTIFVSNLTLELRLQLFPRKLTSSWEQHLSISHQKSYIRRWEPTS